MATLHEKAAFTRNRIREAVTAKVCCGPMEGQRHSKEGPFSGLRTHWRAELAEAVSSVVGGGNNRSVSHVSQPQDGPEWVNLSRKTVFPRDVSALGGCHRLGADVPAPARPGDEAEVREVRRQMDAATAAARAAKI